MRGVALLAVLFVAPALAGCLGLSDEPAPAVIGPGAGRDDVVVVAVVDSGLNPYHWDFVAAKMPQHLDGDPQNDLPLGDDPAMWLRGHPGASVFASHQRIDVTLNLTDPDARVAQTSTTPLLPGLPVEESEPGLYEGDAAQWEKVESSSPSEVHMHWFPGTKVVGYVNFGGGDGFAASSHGVGTSSVSVGNLHGSCPECVLVFVNGPSEVANEWVEQQDWIDAHTNSWGSSLLVRDRLYAGSDTELQREAIERGQSVFFSAGNGQANTFTVPNPTLWSSQEGPDWIITVGAIHPEDGASYSGHGKPADISNIGTAYPSAGGATVNGEGSFGGTSNATPVTAGIYSRALYLLRREMAEASRVQINGTISEGDASCGSANAECALADGRLTVHELRTALFRSAEYAAQAWKLGLTGVNTPTETSEMQFLAEGHGSFWGHRIPAGAWFEESERVAGFANGTWYEEQDPAQAQWMIADSYCRQSLWGRWDHGYWNESVDLPASDAAANPMRTWFIDECPTRGKAIRDAVGMINGR